MRIAIINLTGGGMSGGYRKYLQNILPLMAEDKRVDKLEVYMPVGNALICSNGVFELLNIRADNILKAKTWIENELAIHRPDVIYIPSAIWINSGNIPTVVMIQNMEPLVTPFYGNPLGECIKNIGRYAANLYACRRAQRVIAISKFVKKYLHEKWRISSNRIGLVYHGVNRNSQIITAAHGMNEMLTKIPFLFTAGSIRPARGLEDVINALAILNTEQPMQLAIAGNVDSGMESYFNKLNKMVVKLGISGQVHWLGALNEAEMSWYFKHCEAFIMTSKVESFGMIAGEAMVHGCVCISSDNPCLPEIFGSAALYYHSSDFAMLAKQIESVLSMYEAEKVAMSCTAKNNASNFSWEVCARKTVDEFEKALR